MVDQLKDFFARPIVGLNGFTLTIGLTAVVVILVYVAFFRR